MSARRAALAVSLALGAAAVACGHADTAVVDQYFNAVKTRDNQTLSSFAAVRFDRPVQSWEVKKTLEETSEPLPLPALVQKVKDAESALASNKREASAYTMEHYAEIDQVRDLKSKGRPIPAKLSEPAARWDQFNQKDREGKRALAEARDALEREKRNMMLSLSQADNIESLDGEVKTKKVVVDVTADGQTQPYVMTLKKYEVKRDKGPRVVSRWMVQAVQPQAEAGQAG